MRRRMTRIGCMAGAVALAACGATVPHGDGSAPPRQGRAGSATVITGEQLAMRGGGDLIDGLRGRIANLVVERRPGVCPRITLRGQRTIVGSVNPQVYVDGTRMSDTCILVQLRTRDVDRIEVYTNAYTQPAGYAPSPNGLILVFLATSAWQP